MWFWKIAALGSAGVLDLAAGTLFVHILSVYFSHPLLWWQYAIGATLGASPDIDLLSSFFFRKNPTAHHEHLTHRPIIGVPLAIILGWVIGGEFWAYAAGIGVFWHYLHDTEGFLGLSGGMAWFWPCSKKYWGVRNWRVVSRTLEGFFEVEEVAFDNIYENYLTPTRCSITEFVPTGIFFGCVAGDLFGFHSGVGITAIFWFSIIGLWAAYRFRLKSR